jgi:hypothetical protein
MEITPEDLITEIEKTITQPYSDWAIGLSYDKDVETHFHQSVTFSYEKSGVALLSSYLHFTGHGMHGIIPYYSDATHLYLYKKEWQEFVLYLDD